MRDFNKSTGKRQQAKKSLLWAAACFAFGQLALLTIISNWRQELRDPEYGLKLRSLRARLAEHSAAQPRLLVMGSSRAGVGFRPDVLSCAQTVGNKSPVVFNFSLCYSGPLLELICLRRLLADGVYPDAILLEVWPPLLALESLELNQDTSLNLQRMGWQNIRLLDRYSTGAWTRYHDWWQAQLVPWTSYRFPVMNHLAPRWVAHAGQRDVDWRGLDGWGWLRQPQYEKPLDEISYRIVLERARHLGGDLFDNLQISDTANRAMRELLALCRQRRIKAALLRMPEAEESRGWYAPGSLARVDIFLRELSQEYGVAVLDARDWSSKGDFIDGIHLVHGAAATFSRRLGREAIEPLIGGNFNVFAVKTTATP